MGLPALFQKLFQNDGYGPKLKPSIVPFAASLASSSPDDVASASWVRSNYDAVPVFVDAANGDDSNDGLALGTAVETIGRALEISFSHAGQNASLHIAAGTYAESISLSQKVVSVTLLGNVTLNGYLDLISSSFIVEESTYTFSVTCSAASVPNAVLSAFRNSLLLFNCPVSVTVTSNITCISSYNASAICFTHELNVSVTNSGRVFGCHDSSMFFFAGAVTVTGSKPSYLIDCFATSSMYFGSSFTCSNGVLTNTAVPIRCRYNSTISFTGNTTIYGPTNVGCVYLIQVYVNASISFSGSTTKLYFKPTSGTSLLYLYGNSYASLSGSVEMEFSGIRDAIRAYSGSVVEIDATSLKLNGSISYSTVTVNSNSYMSIDSSTSISGTVTGARRYTVGPCALLNVDGAGANRIPGASAGYVNSGAFGYYG